MSILNVLRGLKKIQASLTSLKLARFTLSNGDTIETDSENITSGNQVFLKSASGDYSLLPDGSYLTKENLSFTIKEGLVETVSTTEQAKEVSTEPIEQAQSKVEEPETITETEVKAADAAVTVDVSDVIAAQLSPVWDAIYAIQTAIDNLAILYVSQDAFSKTSIELTKTLELSNTKLSKVSETVEKIAKMPATEPATGAVHAFAAPVPKEIKDSKAWKIVHGEN